MKVRRKTGLCAAVLATVTMLIAPAAFATNTLSVNGGSSPVGPVSLTGTLPSGGTLSFVSDFGFPITCTTAAFGGTVSRGSTVAAGSQIGAIASLAFGSSSSSCLATGLNYPLVMEKSTKTGAPATWGIFATTTPAKGATTVPVEIRNVSLKIHSTNTTGNWGCDMEAMGTIPARFNQVTQQLTITPSSGVYPLRIAAYDGTKTNTVGAGITCLGQVYDGDALQMTGTFNLTSTGTGIHF